MSVKIGGTEYDFDTAEDDGTETPSDAAENTGTLL